MKTPKIKETDNYDLFQSFIYNRAINLNYVQTLVDSIKKNNLLPYNPIIVNEEMKVIDGQHRLEAAKTLGIEIYYVEAKNATLQDVMLLNANVKRWRITDYMESYVKQGVEDYVNLEEFSKLHDISITNSMALLNMTGTRRLLAQYSKFKRGEWKVTSPDDAQVMAKAINELAPYTEESTHRDRDFVNAVYSVFQSEEINLEDFVDKVRKYRSPIYRRGSVRDYLRQFEDIYNVGLSAGAVRLY